MSNCAEAARPSPDERFREIAAIVAAAVVRLHERAALPPATNLTVLPLQGLEVPGGQRTATAIKSATLGNGALRGVTPFRIAAEFDARDAPAGGSFLWGCN